MMKYDENNKISMNFETQIDERIDNNFNNEEIYKDNSVQ